MRRHHMLVFAATPFLHHLGGLHLELTFLGVGATSVFTTAKTFLLTIFQFLKLHQSAIISVALDDFGSFILKMSHSGVVVN